jgi:hypothetical protein
MAVTGMMNDGEISRERALELARMVLRENAIKLYGRPTETKDHTIGVRSPLRYS